MNNLDDEAAKIQSDFIDYEKRLTPSISIWIRLSFFPLALAAFLGFIHNFQKVPFHPWENIFVSVLIVSIQILIIGSMIQQNFFTRIKNQTDIMKEWFSLDREFSLKIKAHSLDGVKHYLDRSSGHRSNASL